MVDNVGGNVFGDAGEDRTAAMAAICTRCPFPIGWSSRGRAARDRRDN